MFIEHEFETDLASDDVLRRLVEILDQLGFSPIEAGPAMRFRRALREKSQLDLLNSNITAIARHSDRGVSIGIQLDTPGRVGEHHAALCRALAHLCESIIVRGQTLEDARREWDQRIAAFSQPVRVSLVQILLLIALAGLVAYIYSLGQQSGL